jgi:hypothetical protein
MEDLLKQLGVTEQEMMANPSNAKPSILTPTTSALLLTPLALTSMMFGFFGTLALAKRKNAKDFEQGLLSAGAGQESGFSLASRALLRGSCYAIGGSALVGAILYVACPTLFSKKSVAPPTSQSDRTP